MNQAEGIVLRNINYSNTSKIIYVLTEHGIDSLLVKGAQTHKSKLRFLTQPMSLISFNKSRSKNLPILISGDITNSYANIHKDLKKQSYGLWIAEIIYKLSTDIDFSKLYNYTKIVYSKLDNTKHTELISFSFMLKYLYLLGLNPVFSHCVDCSSKNISGFDVSKGGMVCIEHSTSNSIADKEVLDSLYDLYYLDISNYENFKFNKLMIFQIINRYYEYHINFRSKTAEVLRNLL